MNALSKWKPLDSVSVGEGVHVANQACVQMFLLKP